MDETRKLDRTWLCSIVFSDIVNYSSQSVEVQMNWKRHFNNVLTDALRSVPIDDRIVLDTGDGAAICFLGDPEAALLSTLSMRRAFIDLPTEVAGIPMIRLGINLGSVKLVRDVNGNLNALGDGINVAQRVMSFAVPNQVLVSQSFYEVVSRLSDEYMGLFRYDSVRKDKHVREHVVYEVTAPGVASAAASTTVVEDIRATPSGDQRPAQWRGILLFGAIGAALLLVLAVVIFVRFKPQTNLQGSPTVSQSQASRLPESSSVTGPAGPDSVRREPPRTEAREPIHQTLTPSRSKSSITMAPQPAGAPAVDVSPKVEAVADLTGKWEAEVNYSWGAKHSEVMNLKVDRGEVFGTVSYVRTPRGILDGKLEGDKLTFTTKSQTMLGDKTYEEKHLYRGRVSGDTIEFVLQTDSGYNSRPPEMFTARRITSAANGR